MGGSAVTICALLRLVIMDEAVEAGSSGSGGEAEAALIEASIGGDVQAFARLYDRYMERVFKFVYYRVGRRLDAEDLTQEVFLNAWKAVRRYRQTGASFIAWLFTIAHNLVVSFYRKRKDESYPEDLEPVAPDSDADPEGEVMSRHDRLAVRRAVLQLRPEQQQVIVMRFIEDLTYGDIAAALGKKEGTVRVIQHRALAELHRLLAEEVKV